MILHFIYTCISFSKIYIYIYIHDDDGGGDDGGAASVCDA